MFKLACLSLLCFGLSIFAGTPTKIFHTDHRASFIHLEYLANTGADTNLNPEDLAFQYIVDHADRYGLDDTGSLELVRVQESLLGSHFHYQQKLFGHAVFQAELIVSVTSAGEVYQVFNNTYPTQTLKQAAPAFLDRDDAFDVAWHHLRVHDELMAEPKAELVYLPQGAEFRLVYLVDLAVAAPFGYWRHTIDAASGEVIEVKSTAIARKPRDPMDFAAYEGPVLERRLAFRDFSRKQRAEQDALEQFGKAPANGSAKVFDPDPVTALKNSALSDSSPASSFTSAYATRTLQGLDLTSGVYRLNGPWVNVTNFEAPNTAPSTTTTGSWTATRGNNAFNDVMTYFHIDQNQRYIQSLGFSGATGIQYGSITTDSDGVNGDDNSYFLPGNNRIAFGHGCVDDNEDAFVILHEYGHAIHHSINSNWSGGDTGGMGEGFGDYWAASYRNRTANGATFNPAWAFPWDGHNSCWGGRTLDKTSYQYDPTKSYPAHATVGSVYSDELWSTPLFQALLALKAQGIAQTQVDRIILQAHFGLGSGMTMRTMATAIVNTAGSLYPSGPHKSVFEQKFIAQNILSGSTTPPPPPPPTGSAVQNGVPVANLSGAVNSDKLFYIDVPAGATNLRIATSGGTGDCDLYTKFGVAPTTSSYECRPYATGNTEACTVAAPQTGRYYILLHAYSAYSGMTLTASFTAGGGGSCVPATKSYTGLSGSASSWKYYTVTTPACATQLKVTMSGGTGDADLYTRFGAQPTTSSYACRPYKAGNAETCTHASPSAGTWYVGVRGYATYSGVGLTIAYQ